MDRGLPPMGYLCKETPTVFPGIESHSQKPAGGFHELGVSTHLTPGL